MRRFELADDRIDGMLLRQEAVSAKMGGNFTILNRRLEHHRAFSGQCFWSSRSTQWCTTRDNHPNDPDHFKILKCLDNSRWQTEAPTMNALPVMPVIHFIGSGATKRVHDRTFDLPLHFGYTQTSPATVRMTPIYTLHPIVQNRIDV